MSAPQATQHISRGIHSPGPHRADRRQSNVPHRALAALSSAGSAHGERPVVNGKAGVLSAQGSTPPSGTKLPARTIQGGAQ